MIFNDIFEEQLYSLLQIYDAAAMAIEDGRPDLIFAFSAFARMTVFENPEKVIKEEREAAIRAGFPENTVDKGMAMIISYHNMTGQFAPQYRKDEEC